MDFDGEHKVKIETLSREEARDFIYWLLDETRRHETCVVEAENQRLMSPRIYQILDSAIIRHKEDLVGIDGKIREVKEMYGL